MFWRQMSRQLSSASPSVTPNELLEILLAKNYGYYVLPTEPYDEVYPNIFLGDSTTALCIHLLKRLGITHVLNAAWGRQRNLGLVNTSAAFYRNAQIEFMGIEALDMSVFPLYQHFYSAADFIEQALQHPNGKVLVHCGEGISRSSTLVIAYLMIKQGYTVQDAVRAVVKHRNILPNQGFLLQLCHLNDELAARSPSPRIQQNPLPRQYSTPPESEEKQQSKKTYDNNDNYDVDKISVTDGSSRSPTPITAITKPNFNYQPRNHSNSNNINKSNYYRSTSLAPSSRGSSPTSYSSSSSLSSNYSKLNSSSSNSSNYNSNNQSYNYNPNYNRSSSIRPIENKIQMQRRTDFRRAQSVERPNYVTRGSSFLNRCSSSSLSKSQTSLNRSHTNNINNNYGYPSLSNSLMTTYLVNRPLPTISR